MLRDILKNYIEKVSPRVGLKDEKEIAERHLGYIKSTESNKEFKRAN